MIDEEIKREIRKMAEEGASISSISKQCDVSRVTIRRILGEDSPGEHLHMRERAIVSLSGRYHL